MSPEFEALRKNKSAFASVIAAAVGFSLFCLVGAAVLMGWIGPGIHRPDPAPHPVAAGTAANEMGLSPGETVVSAADAPVPPPRAVAPAPEPTAPAATPPPASKPAQPKRPHRRHHVAPADATGKNSTPARSQSPTVAQASPHPTDTDDKWPQPACGNCGVVHSIRVFPDLWEVRVRFDDGGHRTIRYKRPQHWHVGDRIRYEGGRLVPE